MKKILAVASTGGHWIQLSRLMPIFNENKTFFASTDKSLSKMIGPGYYTLRDASLSDKLGLILLAFQTCILVLKVRPDIVVSTGAAPGFFAVFWGRLFGAKTIWIDSIANVDQMSVAGRMVRKWAHVWLTQWPHLAAENGPHYKGKVL